MTAVPRTHWRDLVTARPDECDPIDDPRIKARAFEARVLIVCTIALLVTGYLTGKGWVDYERAHARIELAQKVTR
jgi:hypothetical protein